MTYTSLPSARSSLWRELLLMIAGIEMPGAPSLTGLTGPLMTFRALNFDLVSPYKLVLMVL